MAKRWRSDKEAEVPRSIEFLGLQLDDLNNFRAKITGEISALKANRKAITETVDDLAEAIEEDQAFRYGFDVKIISVPECASHEPALQNSYLCVTISNKMVANITLNDIDITHRLNPRNPSNRANPIICTTARRLAREVLKRSTRMSHVQAREVGRSDAASLINAKIIWKWE